MDEPVQPKSKRTMILAGAGVGVLLLGIGGFAVLAATVESVRAPWCNRVGLFCRKGAGTVVATAATPAAPKKVVPGACPGPKMHGTMRGRAADALASTIDADMEGRITLERDGWTATGRASVTCSGNAFLATFDNMSQRMTYQCMGTLDGKTYAGTCSVSDGVSQDITGAFKG